MTHPHADKTVDQAAAKILGELASRPEGQWFERKSGRVQARDLAVALIAFANAEGGTIVVGLHGGDVDGVSTGRNNDLRQAGMDYAQPPVRTHIESIDIVSGQQSDTQTVLLFRVEPSGVVHHHTNGNCYLRVGDESRKLTYQQRQELELDSGHNAFEGLACDAQREDLQEDLIETYRVAIGAATPDDALRARDLVDRQGRCTYAAALLFSARPQSLLPHAHVRVMHYASNERGYGAEMNLHEGRDVRLDGPLQQQIDGAAQLIEEWMPRFKRLGDGIRFESMPLIPRDVWLEGIVNAVVHRSYSMAGDHIRCELFPQRIEITSPGRFPGIADPTKPLQIDRYARNPRLARVLAEPGLARELGEGIKRMFQTMRRHGLIDPVYTQSSSAVKLTIHGTHAIPDSVLVGLSEIAKRLLSHMQSADEALGTGALADRLGISRMSASRGLRTLQESGLIERVGNSATDPRAVWKLM